MQWVGSRELRALVLLLVAVGGTWAFVELADEVTEGETQRLDDWAVRALRRADDPSVPIGPRWLAESGRDITGLGGMTVLLLVTAAVVGFLWMRRAYHAMWLVVIATAGGTLLSWSLKLLFERERPGQVPHLSYVYSPSFPSGHAMLSAVVYLTLGALLARLVEDRISKFYFLTLALLLTFLVGVSRVYMGVHYPTDVLAGWTAGLVWAVLCWLVARSLQRRGKVERDVTGASDALPERQSDQGVEA